jgi:Ca2+-binding RTX toxin-like protein
MAITTTERAQIIELTVLMFDAAPGSNYLSQIVSMYESNGHNLQSLARTLAITGAYQSLNANFQTAGDFATKLLAPLNLDTDAFARDFVMSKFNSGVSKGDIALAVMNALNNDVTSSSPAQYVAAKAILLNETEVATYYSVTKGIAETDLTKLQAVLNPVTADHASVATAEAIIDQPAQTFNIVTDTASVNEGSTMLFTLQTTGVAAGSTYAYSISGISASDVVGGSLSGTATIGTDGKAVVAVNVAADSLTEGTEAMTFAIAGKSTTIQINDTSTTPAPVQTFNIVTDTASVNEGSTMLFTLETTGVAAGSTYAYTISGVSASDIVGGSLSGVATIGSDGKAVVAVNVAADNLTEGAEAMTFAIAGKSTAVTINDTSTTPAPVYGNPVSTATAVNEGQSVTFYVDTQNVAAGAVIDYSLSGTGITSGDLGNVPLTGHAVVDAFGRASVTITTTADLTTEGAETLTFTYTDPVTSTIKSVDVTINDTSLTPNLNLNLTTGADTGTSFVGGTGNDTFDGMATANTLNTSDVLVGGAGTDTVTALLDGAQTVRPTLTGIEVLSVKVAATAPVTVDLTNSPDLTTLENVQSANTLTFTNASSNVSTLNVRLAPGMTTNVGYTDTALASSANVLNVKVDSSDGATINVNNTSAGGTQVLETLNVEIQTNNDLTPALTIGGNAVSKVVITSDLSSNGVDNAAYTISSGIASVDASAVIGAVTINSGLVATSQTIATGNGADVITGGTAADVIGTGAGNDTITGGAGADNINAGAGNDTLNYASTAELAVDASVDGGAGTDKIVLTTDGQTLTDAQLAKVSGVEVLTTANGVNTVTLGANATTAGLTTINAGTGNDVINTSAAGYTLNAVINAGAGDDNVTTGVGNDTITIGTGNDTVAAGAGSDTIVGGANVTGLDQIDGGAGADTLTLNGDYTGIFAALTLGATTLTNVETISVNGVATQQINGLLVANGGPGVVGAVQSYVITTNDATVAAGQTLTVDGSGLTAVTTGAGVDNTVGTSDDVTSVGTLTFNGAAEADGMFSVTGGAGNDNITGGALADTINGGAGVDTIAAGGGNDLVNGGDGNDIIDGGLGNNTLNGEAGNDSISGGAGVDTIDGGVGDDTIVGSLGADSLSGGDGNDTFQYAAVATLTANAAVDGGAGTDTIALTAAGLTVVDADLVNVHNVEVLQTGAGANFVTLGANAVAAGMTNVTGGAGNDTIDTSAVAYTLNAVIDAGAGDDNVTTGAGNDTITIGAGDDTVTSGAGNDTIVGGANVDGADVINGGTGSDTLTLAGGATAGVADGGAYAGAGVTLTSVTNVETITVAAGLAAVDNVSPVFDVAGSTNDYTLTLVAGNVTAGNTLTVDASALRAGVVTTLGAGSQVNGAGFVATDENLTLVGGAVAGILNVTGGAAADTITTGTGNDIVNGGAGNDTIDGGAGADSIVGGAGDDSITGGSGRDTLLGGDGNDVFVMTGNEFSNDADSVDGGAGNDAVQISLAGAISVPDVGFNGRFGSVESLQFSGVGTATMNMGFYSQNANVTSVSSVAAGALLNVDATNYTIGLSISGNAGNDTISGGSGNDTLSGGAGNDAIVGGAGNDLITIGAGQDTVDGGTGNDTIVGGANLTAADQINGNAGTDQLNLDGEYTAGNLGALVFLATTVTNVETLSLDGVAAEAVAGTPGTVAVTQSYDITTNDATVGAGLVMTVDASDLRSVATGAGLDGNVGTADDVFSAGTLAFSGAAELDGMFSVVGGAGNDTITGGALADTISGGAGDDTINTGNGANIATGGAGNDTITGGTGADSIDGGTGTDSLVGGGGNDTIIGGEGADTITGGTGADTITLTETVAARDTLIVGNGDSARLTPDVVTGFSVDSDTTVGLNATADVLDFGSVLLVATGVTDGVVGGTLASSMQSSTSFLAALQLLENEFHNQAGAQNGTVAFQFGTSTYVAEVTGVAGAELVTDIVQLVGVTGINHLLSGGGTAVGVSVNL